MPASPEQVRGALMVVTTAAAAEAEAVVAASPSEPGPLRSALFAAAPLIVAEYASAAAELAVAWFSDLRDAAGVLGDFEPTPIVSVTDDDVAAMVAQTTSLLYDFEKDVARIEAEIQLEIDQALENLQAEIEREVAESFRSTITTNSKTDPESVGWRRFARPGACKFCLMLAARGAVYTADTARFAAHGAVMRGDRKGGNCMCVAGPAYGGKDVWAEATPIQYVASKKQRSDAERAAVRAYLNENFPDAPG